MNNFKNVLGIIALPLLILFLVFVYPLLIVNAYIKHKVAECKQMKLDFKPNCSDCMFSYEQETDGPCYESSCLLGECLYIRR